MMFIILEIMNLGKLARIRFRSKWIMRALLKPLRLIKHKPEVAMEAMTKFSELDRELAARGTERCAGTLRQTRGRLLERLEHFSAWSTKKRKTRDSVVELVR
jgi:hypothetical protein